MPCKSTPSFILELPLRTKPADERECGIILRASQNIYNAVLGEALKRIDRMRASAACQAARAMPKGKARSQAFERVRKQFGGPLLRPLPWEASEGFVVFGPGR